MISENSSLLTVHIPVHIYKPKLLNDCVESVLAAAPEGSTILIHNSSQYKFELNSKVTEIISPPKTNLATKLNQAMRQSTSKYFARMDYDDISHPDRFKEQIEFLEENPDIDILGTWGQIIREDYDSRFESSDKLMHRPVLNYQIRRQLLFGNAFIHSSVMFRLEKLLPFSYNEKLEVCQDYDLWTRASRGLRMANLPSIGVFYRVHSQQTGVELSRTSRNNYRKIRLRHNLISLLFTRGLRRDAFGSVKNLKHW